MTYELVVEGKVKLETQDIYEAQEQGDFFYPQGYLIRSKGNE